MAYSKVTLNGTTIMDVTQDTVNASNLLSGETATRKDGVSIIGEASAGTLITKTITENGTYSAEDDDADGYSEVTVNVPSGGFDINDIVSNDAPYGMLNIDTATTIQNYSLYNKNNITAIHSKSVTTVGGYAIRSTGLVTAVFEKLTFFNNYAMGSCTSLKSVDILGTTATGSFKGNTFNASSVLDTLVIRLNGVYLLSGGISVFANTPFASGGSGGTLYVPQAQIASYQSASNWSTILGYANNQIKSIESTHTDPDAPIDLTLYYADGTPIT